MPTSHAHTYATPSSSARRRRGCGETAVTVMSIEYRRGVALTQPTPHLGENGSRLDRLGEICAEAHLAGADPIVGQRMSGQRDDRNRARRRIVTQDPRCLPPVHPGDGDVHENQI